MTMHHFVVCVHTLHMNGPLFASELQQGQQMKRKRLGVIARIIDAVQEQSVIVQLRTCHF